MDKVVLYIHGQGGSASESCHYKSLFPECEVLGMDYQTFSPWETGEEIRAAVLDLSRRYADIILIANSIGAYFSMIAGIDRVVRKAFFISPVVDMENVNGIELDSEWFSYVRSHPVEWVVPTHVLYGSMDNLIPFKSVREFADRHSASLTVIENGEHWFHTEEQMKFLDEWINRYKFDYFTLRDRPEKKDAAALWFHNKWSAPQEAYQTCMDRYLDRQSELGWYLCLDGDRIIGGLGVVENDFHDRKDLTPNICAVYTEPEFRRQGIAGRLLGMAVEDLRSKGISPVYLLTDHSVFYERYGWEFLCMAQGDGEVGLSRMYIHY